jgi:membrane protein YqaA with SNARE-associated domain
MSENSAIFSLFISSLLGATLLPGGSEAVLAGVLHSYPDSLWIALSVSTLGNTIGGMISYWMGWMLPQTQQLKHVDKLRRFGAPALLLAWAPLIGDALCLAAGWLRLNPWHSSLYMAAGKLIRYALIAAILIKL